MPVVGVFLPDYLNGACLRALFPLLLFKPDFRPDLKVFEPVYHTVLVEVDPLMVEYFKSNHPEYNDNLFNKVTVIAADGRTVLDEMKEKKDIIIIGTLQSSATNIWMLNELKNYITQFDASLIEYNITECSADERFNITIPDRLITSVTSGVPVAIPRCGYTASKEYVKKYKALIEFDSPRELLWVLNNRVRVRELRTNAQINSKLYVCSGLYNGLMAFIQQIKHQKGNEIVS